MSRVTISVAVDEAHQAQSSTVAAALQAAGMQVEHTMQLIGMITGTIESSQIASLSRVAGVASVEQDHAVQLPPADSPLQ